METDPDKQAPRPNPQVGLRFHPDWYHVTLANIGDAVITTDPEGRVTFLNPAAESLTGWTRDEATGLSLESVFRIVNRETRQAVESPTVRALLEHMNVGLTNHTLLIARDGTERPIGSVDYSATPIRNDQDEVAGAVLIFRDITDLCRQEQNLKEALSYADNIISTLREPFLVLDKNLRVKTANTAFCRTFHVSKEETENQFVYALGNGQWNIPRLRTLLDNVLADHHDFHDFEVEHTFPTMGHRIMLLDARRFESQNEFSELILLAIEDVTDHRQLERAKIQAELSADLHRRKDEFLAMLSHELRNPLAPIQNAVHLLRLRPDADPIKQQARTIIERQVGQLAHLVNELLEVSRITTGRIQLHQEWIVLSGVVESAVESARPLIEQRRHELTVSLSSHPIWVFADAVRLEQVLVNLLNNAAKYMDEGGHLRLSVLQEGKEAIIRVRDSGVGIAPNVLPRIFDLFTQAERSLDRSQGGLGIGLALVQRLVELHGGKVEAHSSLGHGSEFVVRLPMAQAPAPGASASNTETGNAPSSSLRVLVVEDNIDAAQSLAALLQVHGHQVRTIYTGQDALQAALDYRPHVILLDIGLPGMNGYEVAQKVRQRPELGKVVLVALTGYGQDSDQQYSQEVGFDHHLVKPADFSKVREILAIASEKAI